MDDIHLPPGYSDISMMFVSQKETTEPEHGLIIGQSQIPRWLKGNLLYIGPGLFDLSDSFSLKDYLDGYGIITGFKINPSASPCSISLRKRYVSSEAYRKANKDGIPAFTEFGTPAMSLKPLSIFSKLVSTLRQEDMSDNAGISLYMLNGHLCASSATHFLHIIDPETLDTLERLDVSKAPLKLNGFGIHPLEDEGGDLWNMGFSVLPTLKYQFVKIPKSGGLDKSISVAQISSRWTGAIAFNHSFGMSKSYLVFIEQSLVVRTAKVLASKIQGLSVKDWLHWRPEDKPRFYIIDKCSGAVICSQIQILSEESFFFLHVLNCYEDSSDNLVIDVITSIDASAINATELKSLRENKVKKSTGSKLQRFVIPLKYILEQEPGSGVSSRFKGLPEKTDLLLLEEHKDYGSNAIKLGPSMLVLGAEDLTPEGVDQVAINSEFKGKDYQWMYCAGSFLLLGQSSGQDGAENPFLNSICKVNVKTKEIKRWYKSPSYFPGEPIFIPVPKNERDFNSNEEDSGVIACPIHNMNKEEKNFLLFLDGSTFQEIARVDFDNSFGGIVHGIFIPDDN